MRLASGGFPQSAGGEKATLSMFIVFFAGSVAATNPQAAVLSFHSNCAEQGTIAVLPDSGVHIMYDIGSGVRKQMVSDSPFIGDFDVTVEMNAACTPDAGYHTDIWIGDTTGYGFLFGVNTIHCGSTPSHHVEKLAQYIDFYENGYADYERFTTGTLGAYIPMRIIREGNRFLFFFNNLVDSAYSDTAALPEVFLGFGRAYGANAISREVSDAYYRVMSGSGFSSFWYKTGCGPCDCTGFCDLNLDGPINPLDVVIIVNDVYKSVDQRRQIPLCPYGQSPDNKNGDWNCDGLVNPVDVVRYVNFVYKAQTNLPPCGPCNCTLYPPVHPGDCPQWP